MKGRIEIKQIVEAIREKRLRITDHADEEADEDKLSFEEIYSSVLKGKDKPYPSCLILGATFSGDPIHSVWAYNEESCSAVLITVYRPDQNRWIDLRKRR